MIIYQPSGVLVRADVTDPRVPKWVLDTFGQFPLIGADPPYGDIVSESWDSVLSIIGPGPDLERRFVDWMIGWVKLWTPVLQDGGAMYLWGGIGRPTFRPFYAFLSRVEHETGLTLANHITWRKKRAYGIQHNYLFCREECAYLIKGDPKKPRIFNVPLTDVKRGYAGFDPAHPAKSEFKRISNVWLETDATEPFPDVWDETEIMRGKRGPCQKPASVMRIPILAHTNPGEAVLDLFAGTGSLSHEARAQGRGFLAIERGETEYTGIVDWFKE